MKRSAAKKNNAFLKFAVIAFCLYIIIELILGVVQLNEKRNQLNSINNAYLTEQEKNVELKRQNQNGSDDKNIEQYMYEQHGYAHPGETVYYNIGG